MSKEPLISKYLFSKAKKNKIPLNGTFELSPICNMDCKMCYIRMDSKEVNKCGGLKTVDEWLEIAQIAKDNGMLFLLLTGGEPFLYKDFKKLYFELKKMGLMISINTNGTLIDEETIKWLSKDPPYRINMTLYGASNETYYKLCNNPKGFDQVKRASKLLKENGITFKLNASITPYNIDDIDLMFEFAKEYNVYLDTATYMFPPVRKDKDSIGVGNRFTPEEVAKANIKIDKIRFKQEEYLKYIETIKSILNERLNDKSKEDCDEKISCRAGTSTFWITWDGRMTPCGMMNFPESRPFEDGFTKAWHEIVEKTEEIIIPKSCSKCKNRVVCNMCPAMVATETGSFHKKPDYICNITQGFLNEINKEYNINLSYTI